jgi:hypothetical protein
MEYWPRPHRDAKRCGPDCWSIGGWTTAPSPNCISLVAGLGILAGRSYAIMYQSR